MTTTVYRTYDLFGTLLYVGCTSGLEQRMKNHEQNSPWWPFFVDVRVETFARRSEALAAEWHAIQTEHPRWNVRGRSEDHPDGPIRRSVLWTPHLREEVELWREWKQARTAELIGQIRRERVEDSMLALSSARFEYERARRSA